MFWIATAVTGVLLIFCLFLKETRPSLLLEREVAVLRKQFPGLAMKTLNPDNAADFRALVQGTLVRPLCLLFTEPIVMFVAFMGSVTCAIYYLFADALLVVFTSYGWTAPQASLAFIPLAVGHFLGFLTRWHDRRSLARRKARGETIEPESKLFWFAVAAPVLTASLWWFSWTIPPLTHVHFRSPMISLIPVGFALMSLSTHSLATWPTATPSTLRQASPGLFSPGPPRARSSCRRRTPCLRTFPRTSAARSSRVWLRYFV